MNKKKIVYDLMLLFVQKMKKLGFGINLYNDYYRGQGASAFKDRKLYFNCHCSYSPESISITGAKDSCTLNYDMFYILKINENDTYETCKIRFEKLFEEMQEYLEKDLEPHFEDRREF